MNNEGKWKRYKKVSIPKTQLVQIDFSFDEKLNDWYSTIPQTKSSSR